MKNNTIGTVAVSNTKRPRARFNISADVHTTMDFGSVIPARVHQMIPNSKEVFNSKFRILFSPMLSPTMGRISLKGYHQFVPFSDLTDNFAPMMAQESVSRGDSQFVPQNVPMMRIRDLSVFVLIGAYLNVYKAVADDSATTGQASANIYSGTTGVLASDADLTNLELLNKFNFGSTYGSLTAFGLSVSKALGLTIPSGGQNVHIPLGNPTNATFYPIDPSCTFFENASESYDLSDVTPDNADYVIPCTVNNTNYFLCFRLSDFGKRIRKCLIGCGYQVDYTNDEMVSLLPLCAFFKSYFDVFGLTLYQNWEQTWCYRFLRSCDLLASPSLDDYWVTTYSSTVLPHYNRFINFMTLEFGATYFTDEQDFVSAHTRSTAVSPSPGSFVSSIDTDVDTVNTPYGTPSINNNQSTTEPGSVSPAVANGHSFISSVIHGHLDSELLKRLYRWTNRNTIAGRRIAEILRSQGLGAYVDSCKADFIGSFEIPINIYDGISGSDTYDVAADTGAPLGERYGNGQADGSTRPFEFESSEFGFWITLITVVPKAGYAEAIDPTVKAFSKFQFYNPEFDSLGMEFRPKSEVVGSMPFADFQFGSGRLSDSFGLSPRFFCWKFGRNIANGDFTRRGRRSAFMSYYVDRVIDVGARHVRDISTGTSVKTYQIRKDFPASALPIAGNVWRYPTRYAIIGRLERIFAYYSKSMIERSGIDVGNQMAFEFFSSSEDNIIVHMINDDLYFAPMLPVEDSFETYDDDNPVNASMGKA